MASTKNEAKVKFTAETAEFTKNISDANNTIKNLNSELKLAEAEFKASGNEVQYYSQKSQALKSQLEANQQKQQALTQKLEAAKQAYGEDSTEVGKLKSSLNYAQVQEQNLKAKVEQCNDALYDAASAAANLSPEMQELKTDISNQETELVQLKSKYADVVAKYGETSTEAQELSGKISTLNTSLDNNKSKLEGTSDKADTLGDKVEDAGDKASNSSGGFDTMKVAVGNLASEAISKAVDKLKELVQAIADLGIDYTSSMSYVEALISNTSDDIDGDMEMLEAAARSAGESTVYSAAEAADALGYMALAGWDANEMASGLDGVLNLAAASDMDLAEASDIVTDNLTAFGLSADDSSDFVDMMTYAMSNSNTTTEELGEAYKNCAATAASMGYTAEDTTAVLMTMANAGVKGGEAGTALNTIMTRIGTNDKAVSALEKYGISAFDAEGNSRDLSEILGDLQDIWGDLTDKEQANLSKAVAGTNQYSKFQTIMAGLSDEAEASGSSFNAYSDALDTCEGTAEEMSETMTDNLGGDLKEMQSKFQEVGLEIFEVLEPALRAIVQLLAKFATALSIAITAITKFVKWLIQKIPKAFEKVKKVFSTFKNIASKFIGRFTNIKDKCTTAIATLRTNVSGKLTAMKDKFTNIGSAIKEKFVGKFSDIKEAVIEKVTALKEKISGIIETIKGFFDFSTKTPDIKLPHFSITPTGWKLKDLLEGTMPKLSIKWYATGGVFDSPTIAGIGEAGPEAVAPIDVLQGYVADAVSSAVTTQELDYDRMGQVMAAAVSRLDLTMELNNREVGRMVRSYA